jgi:hypothetical protein
VISSPFADEALLDRDAEQNQIESHEDQSNRRTCDWVSAQSQQTSIQNREDDHLSEAQYADAEEVKQEDPDQE